MLKSSFACLLLMLAVRLPAAEMIAAQETAHDAVRRVVLSRPGRDLQELTRAVALTVFFRTGSLDVEAETLTRIRLLGGLLQEFPELRVYLDAYSDRRGSNAHNRRLSRARADVIAGVLRDAGVPADRILGNAWGESRARATADDAEGLIFDRRVDIQLSVDPET